MKIEKITLTNWLAHAALTIDCRPLTVVVGPNASGKSSIAEAIPFCLFGGSPRIALAGERANLITRGRSKGSVAITADGLTASRNIKDGKMIQANSLIPPEITPATVGCCIDPSQFALLGPVHRRDVVSSVMRADISPQGVMKKMTERGRVRACLEQLPGNANLDVWRRIASEKMSEARGAWKAVTGETYGPAKAAGWAMDAPAMPSDEESQAAVAEVQIKRRELLAAEQKLEAGIQYARAAAQVREQRAAKQALADALADRQAALEQKAEARRAATLAWQQARDALDALPLPDGALRPTGPAEPHLACPECGCGPLTLRDGKLARAAAPPANESDARDQAILDRNAAKAALDSAMNAAGAAELAYVAAMAAVQESHAAAAWIESADAMQPPPPYSRAQAEQWVTDARAALKEAEEREAKLLAQRSAATAAERVTANASLYHQTNQHWSAIADDIAPDGIPGELVNKLLGEFNDGARALAAGLGWIVPAIDADMNIAATNGAGEITRYAALSKSERWRADAVLAMTLSYLSGFKAVVLDGFDILDVSARTPLVKWLDGKIKDGTFDSVLLLGTLKAPPPMPASVGVTWLGADMAEAA